MVAAHSALGPYLLIVLFPLRSHLVFRGVAVVCRRDKRQRALNFDQYEGLDTTRRVRRRVLTVKDKQFVK